MRTITGARVVLGSYSRAGAADAMLNQAHYRPRTFDVHFQSDRNRVYSAPSAPRQSTGAMVPRFPLPADCQARRVGTGNVTFATGDLGEMSGVATQYLDVLKKYAGMGGKLGADIVETASKALSVVTDVSTGAAMGATFGPIGAGAGAVIAGIYSTFDNFGGDIMAVFNPPDFNEGDYDRMKKNCMRSGGIPNFGHAPDNEDGCIYPDGTMSGGDYPRHPPPGVKMIRGDSFYDYDAVANLCLDKNGKYVPLPPGWGCAQGLGPVPPPPPPPVGPALLAPVNKSGYDGAAHAASAEKRVAMLHALPPGGTLAVGAQIPFLPQWAQDALAKEGIYAPGKAPKPIVIVSPKAMLTNLLPPATKQAVVTVAAAMTGDPKASVAMATTVDAARSGDAQAISAARLLTHAQRLIMIQSFVSHYLLNTMGTAGTGTPCCRGCGGH